MPELLPPLSFALAYLLTGVLAGFFAGLLGVGGGVVVVPLLTLIFAGQAFPANEVLHLALGTSMASILFTSLSSLRAHHQHGAVLWPTVRRLTPGILVGTLIGTQVAALISSQALSVIFLAILIGVAVQMAGNFRPKPCRGLPGAWGLAGAGSVIGLVASLAAMGGGALTVPYLVWCNVKAQRAIGTSAAVGLPLALSGSLGYVWQGWGHPGLPAGSLGFIYLPALALILVASMVAAPLGAGLAHRLPVRTLKRVFAALLLVLAGRMVWQLYLT